MLSFKRDYIVRKLKFLHNGRSFYNGREMIFYAYNNEIFPFYHEKSGFEDEDKNDIRDENGLIDYKINDRPISLKERGINNYLIRNNFKLKI